VPPRRRSSSQFNLAFLDVMCCGFGAVVLLVMLLNGDMLATRKEIVTDLRSEVMRIEREVKVGKEHLVSLQNSMVQTEEEIVRTEGLSRQVISNLEQTKLELATMSGNSQAAKKHINALQSDLLNLDAESRRIGAEQQTELARGAQVREFIGQGDRQYLTGLRLGGKRVLLLVDASASMLDETIVNIIVRRNLDDRSKRSAPKWKRTIRTAEWLTANLPADSSLQLYTFNTDLYKAFAAAARMKPRPDNILLLTDGLPTQGEKKSSKNTISGDERLKLFHQATGVLPRAVPINTILFPMEGDPMAAVSFWKLAIETGGSFLTPTRDWP